MPDNTSAPGYDVIGDVHGMFDMLVRLLLSMGYEEHNGVWKHPIRTAVFVGDFADRGKGQVATYRLVRAMMEAGSALATMGNHEFNAIAFHTPDGKGGHRRQRSAKNTAQHQSFLAEVGLDTPLHDEMIAWFLTLPLWLELDNIRVVHACWDKPSMEDLAPYLDSSHRLALAGIEDATAGNANAWRADGTRLPMNPAFHAVETLLKGVEVNLPDGLSYSDADGHIRTATRVAWWQGQGATYRSSALLPSAICAQMPTLALPEAACRGYADAKPLFIGHYWMTGLPSPLTPKVACVDYSVAKGGPMVAYRWSGEVEIDPAHYHVVTPA